jgi:hypothetical protein
VADVWKEKSLQERLQVTMSGWGENIAIQLVSELIIKTSVLGYHIINNTLMYVNEAEKYRLRLRVQIRIWDAVNEKFKDAEFRGRIKPTDSMVYAEIMKHLNKLLRQYIKRKMVPSPTRTNLLEETSAEELFRKIEDQEVMQRLSNADRQSSLQFWLKLKAEAIWTAFAKNRDEELVTEVEFWGGRLDRFTSWILPLIFQHAEIAEIAKHVGGTDVLTATNLKAQVMIARSDTALSEATTLAEGFSLVGHASSKLDVTRIRFVNQGYPRSPRPGPDREQRDGASRMENRSELGGEQRRKWAYFVEDDGSQGTVIVEFKTRPPPHDLQFTNAVIEEIEKLVRTLRSASKNSATFRVLDCAGWYEAPDHFGIVYRPPVMGPDVRCQSLGNILLDPKYLDLLQQDLENRLNLSKALAWTLFELHSVDWVHESFNPDNIILFGEEVPGHGIIKFDWGAPYLVGFDSSRTNTGVSGKANLDAQWNIRLYTHPDRQSQTYRRYHKIHDIYSLGVVLLEIGRLGSFMAERLSGKIFPAPLQLKDLYIQTAMSLHTVIGRAFRGAVLECLNGQFVNGNDDYLLVGEFRNRVCQKLDEIRVS